MAKLLLYRSQNFTQHIPLKIPYHTKNKQSTNQHPKTNSIYHSDEITHRFSNSELNLYRFRPQTVRLLLRSVKVRGGRPEDLILRSSDRPGLVLGLFLVSIAWIMEQDRGDPLLPWDTPQTKGVPIRLFSAPDLSERVYQTVNSAHCRSPSACREKCSFDSQVCMEILSEKKSGTGKMNIFYIFNTF